MADNESFSNEVPRTLNLNFPNTPSMATDSGDTFDDGPWTDSSEVQERSLLDFPNTPSMQQDVTGGDVLAVFKPEDAVEALGGRKEAIRILGRARSVLQTFASKDDMDLLNSSGIGNNPEIARNLAKIYDDSVAELKRKKSGKAYTRSMGPSIDSNVRQKAQKRFHEFRLELRQAYIKKHGSITSS